MKITLDASRMDSRRPAHEYLKAQMDFPEYYGKNLDALYDCLGDLNDVEVEFINIPEEETYFKKVLRVFRDAAKRNPGLVIAESEN